MKSIFGVSLLNSRLVALLCLQTAALSGALAWAQSPPPAEAQPAALTTQSPPTYSVRDLGTGGGLLSGTGFGINDRGEVVGGTDRFTPGNGWHPFLWQDGKITDLGTLGGGNAWAAAINNESQVVGTSETGNGPDTHAFLWRSGHMMDIGTLGGSSSSAGAINDKGQVVGSSTTSDGSEHVFLWQDGQMRDLGTLGGSGSGHSSYATGINNRGQVVGSSFTADGEQHAFLWQNGKMTDIGAGPPGVFTYAVGINQAGEVAGTSVVAENAKSHVFLWQNGRTTDLGDGFANSIDNKGQVVGAPSYLPPYGARLWQDGKVFALNTLIPPASGANLAWAYAINNAGQIVAVGNGAYVLTPTHTVDAVLQLSLPSWRFAAHPIGQTSGPATIWIYNTGPAAADFNTTKFTGADPQDFAIAGNTCGSALAPFTTCKVIFHFTPAAVGERTASLSLNDNAKDGPHAIPVQGFGSSK